MIFRRTDVTTLTWSPRQGGTRSVGHVTRAQSSDSSNLSVLPSSTTVYMTIPREYKIGRVHTLEQAFLRRAKYSTPTPNSTLFPRYSGCPCTFKSVGSLIIGNIVNSPYFRPSAYTFKFYTDACCMTGFYYHACVKFGKSSRDSARV